jgi:hypothetical protein
VKLENWFLVYGDYDPYKPPECNTQHLAGKVFGNPNFNDGEEIRTSPIVGKEGDKIVTKSGSVYELGEVLPDYEKQYPGARERLFNSVK